MVDYTAWLKNILADTRLNRMTNVPNTGAYLAGLDKTKHGILICTSTGSGYTLDNVYLCKADGTGVINLSGTQDHVHNNTAGQGGAYDHILSWNSDVIDLKLTKFDDVAVTQWNQTFTSTGTFSTDVDGTTGERSSKLSTGVTSGASATLSYPHLKMDFTHYSLFEMKVRFSTFSSLAAHCGIACDDVTSADTNTRKIQAEVCTATNNNWWLRTANGSSQTASDSGTAATTSRVAIDLETDPTAGTPTTWMYIGGVTVITKTSNIPTSGTTADNNLIKHSIKNSTGADRPLFVYGSRLIYSTADTWGH